MPLLEETKRNIERNIGLSLEQMRGMSLKEIYAHIKKEKGKDIENLPHDPRYYRKVRGNAYLAMGMILTRGQHEDNINRLLKKYL